MYRKGTFIHYCRQSAKSAPVVFNSGIKLYPYQKDAIEPANSADFGVLVAPPGSGKTIMGLEIIARKKQPALIVVHRKQLFDQWVERIQSFLGIAKKDIGRVSGTEKKPGERITVGMIQSLHRAVDNDEIPDTFGTIIVDECHHIPAKTFRETITRFHSYYLYGLTATPMRKNNDENLIYVFIGNIISEIKSDFLDDKKAKTIQINIRNTDLRAPFDYRIDNYETLSQILVYDTARNRIILDDLTEVIEQKKSTLVFAKEFSAPPDRSLFDDVPAGFITMLF